MNKKSKPPQIDISADPNPHPRTPLPTDFSSDKLKEINKLDLAIDFYLDRKSRYFRAVLGQYVSLGIREKIQVSATVLVGAPSVQKSSMMNVLVGLQNTIVVDDFSPKAFVSGKAKLGEDGEEVQLINKIKNKLMITSDLGPLFTSPQSSEILGKLVRIYDGYGMSKFDGLGEHGTNEIVRFNHIAAIPKMNSKVMSEMAHLGSRIFFLQIAPPTLSVEEVVEKSLKILKQDRNFKQKMEILNNMVKAFLENIEFKIDSITWNSSADEADAHLLISRLATLLSITRGGVDQNDGESLKEATPRIVENFYTCTQGQAILEGRNFIKLEDVWLASRICIDSCPIERKLVILELLKHKQMNLKDLKLILSPKIKEIIDEKLKKRISARIEKQIAEMQLIGLITINSKRIVKFDPTIKKLMVELKDDILMAVRF